MSMWSYSLHLCVFVCLTACTHALKCVGGRETINSSSMNTSHLDCEASAM